MTKENQNTIGGYPICCQGSGPTETKIVIVGEAPGKDEEILGVPFVGSSGQELTRILEDAGIDRKTCYLTNVIQARPPNNKLAEFCGNKKEVGGKAYTLPPLSSGKYLRPEFLPELDRLKSEIESIRPNLIIALGGTASWALLTQPKITKVRGTIAESTLCPGIKVLPTFHPAAILRQWDNRAIMVADMMKAAFECKFPEIRRPRRVLWLEPTIADIEKFFFDHLVPAEKITLDIETEKGQITCISFAPSEDLALSIPIWDKRQPDFSYWPDEESELAAWSWIKKICKLKIEKEGQNGLYDIQYLWRFYGIPVMNYTQDTMILHHSLQPEMPKDLGTLGSLYTNEASWKHMRTAKAKDQLKRDD